MQLYIKDPGHVRTNRRILRASTGSFRIFFAILAIRRPIHIYGRPGVHFYSYFYFWFL